MKLTVKNAAIALAMLVSLQMFTALTVSGQQAVTRIVTDYTGYWATSTTNVNPVKPVNSHNLLAFTHNGTQYSTGVNDGLLTNHGQTFVQGDFWALPVAGLSNAVTSNTKIGLGEMYDGVHAGASNPAPVRDINRYLTDGVKGLDLGTCIANLPAGTLTFFIANIRAQNIGDGVPDILITQVADHSNSHDRYSLTDANGQVIGTPRDVVFGNISPVGNWTADFYEASTNPLTLASGFTNTDRPIRLWAADLSDFGITQANYQNIARFRIELSGNSDVAFVAYNNRTFSINSGVLPVSLTAFTGKATDNKTVLNWSTATESNTKRYIIERSADNRSFVAIDSIDAAGNSSSARNYSAVDATPVNGANFYRLRVVDHDGRTEFSKAIKVEHQFSASSISLSPNPASNFIRVRFDTPAQSLRIFNASGAMVKQVTIAEGNRQVTADINALPKGAYYVVIDGENSKQTTRFVK